MRGKRLYFVLLCTTCCLYLLSGRAVAHPVGEAAAQESAGPRPAAWTIPPEADAPPQADGLLTDRLGTDSTGVALRDLYRAGMEAADRAARQSRYREAVTCYAEALDRLKAYTGHCRQYAAVQLEARYRTGAKEQRVAFLDQTLRLRKTRHLLLLVLSLGILAALAGLFLLCAYRLRCVRLRAGHDADQAAIAALTRERLELEAQLRHAEATRYRRELLVESLMASYKQTLMEELRRLPGRLDGPEDYREGLEAIISRHMPADEAQRSFGADIRHLHPQFYQRLQDHAARRLSSLDLEYCRMIYLGMSTKEMAGLLRVEPRTVRVHKYRLKRRLALDSDDDLAAFIRTMI